MPTPMQQWLERMPGIVSSPRLATTPETSAGTPAPVPTPDPGTTTPTTPAAPDPMLPPEPAAPALAPGLRDWLLQHASGNNVLDQAAYDYFHGDDILRQIQQFDPNARWTPTEIGGGEAGTQGQGLRLDFDVTKLPGVGGPGGGKSIFDAGLVPVYDSNQSLRNADMVYDDPYYGRLTPVQNVNKPKGNPWLEYGGPIAVSLVAPYAAAGLAAAGYGGAAGLTAAATGSGLAAGAASPWWATTAAKSLPAIGKTIGGPPSTQTWTPPNVGSLPKPTNNDSSLVATQFADDPYGFSKGT